MKRIIPVISSIMAMLMVLVSTGCSPSATPSVSGKYVYYINSAFTSLIAEEYTQNENPGIDDMIEALQTPTTIEGEVAPLAGITVLSVQRNEKKLVLELGREYNSLSGIREILVRAAVVKSLTQLDDIEEIEMMIGDSPLLNSNGEPVGSMRSRDFVEYFGKEQDAISSEDFIVYYSTQEGDGLVREVHRGYYENTMSREQAVIKYMQEPPETDGARVAITSYINIINIMTADGICYLDMDMSFYDAEGTIPYNIALAAIVNSLCELSGVHSVQVTIIEPADSILTELSETISGSYEKNMELVVN